MGRSPSVYYRWYESSLYCPFSLRPNSFLDTPEAGPGTILSYPIRFLNEEGKDLSDGATPEWTDTGVPLTTSHTCASTRESSLIPCTIRGVFFGRVAAFSIICGAIFYLRRRRRRAQSLAYMGDDVRYPQTESSWKSPSDRTSVDTSTLNKTLTALTKPYVRVFMPCKWALELSGSDLFTYVP